VDTAGGIREGASVQLATEEVRLTPHCCRGQGRFTRFDYWSVGSTAIFRQARTVSDLPYVRCRQTADEETGLCLQVEQLLGVTAGDLQAVGFADGGLIKPLSRLDHVLVRVIN
jgi:hypothetical protein